MALTLGERRLASSVLTNLHRVNPITKVIHGRAPGADSLGAEWAVIRGIPTEGYDAKWREHGRAAGPIRNQLMLDKEMPQLVVAFPGGKGTADMIRRAKAAYVPVMEPSYPSTGLPMEEEHERELDRDFGLDGWGS